VGILNLLECDSQEQITTNMLYIMSASSGVEKLWLHSVMYLGRGPFGMRTFLGVL